MMELEPFDHFLKRHGTIEINYLFDQNFTFFGENTFENSRFDHPF